MDDGDGFVLPVLETDVVGVVGGAVVLRYDTVRWV